VKSEPTIEEGQDLDVPTFLRKNVRAKKCSAKQHHPIIPVRIVHSETAANLLGWPSSRLRAARSPSASLRIAADFGQGVVSTTRDPNAGAD